MMKIEIDVPDNVVEKIKHMMALGIADKMSLDKYLVSCVVADTRCLLESASCKLPKEWPNVDTPA